MPPTTFFAPTPQTPPSPNGGRCSDCGADLFGEYCSACGQRDEPIQQPVGHFVREAFTEYFDLDGRFWLTLGALFFKPGHLTVAYNAGRRQRYVRPFRLYLSATVLFFFALALVDPARGVGGDPQAPSMADSTQRASERLAVVDSSIANVEESLAAVEENLPPGVIGLTTTPLNDQLRALQGERADLESLPPDSIVNVGSADGDTMRGGGLMAELPSWLKGPAIRRLEAADTRTERDEAKRDLARAMIARVPTAMFLLLPVFAGMMKVLYLSGGGLRRPGRRSRLAAGRARRRQRRLWRKVIRAFRGAMPLSVRARRRARLRGILTAKRTRYLAEHLVFALHVHSFAFLIFLVILLLSRAGEAPLLGRAMLFLAATIPVYFLLAQKRVYAQGWIKTLLKAFVLGVTYSVVLSLGAVLALGLAAALG